MKSPARALVILLLFVPLGWTGAAAQEPAGAWPDIKPVHRPWTRWWWPGSAVDHANLTRELEAFAAAGFGGVEVTPIYGAKGSEARYLPFLSPPYLRELAFAGAEAKRLGLGLEMATGTGWPFGGPQVTAEDAEQKISFDPEGKIRAVPTKFRVKRAAPGGEGWVLNPYSITSLSHYLEPFTRALSALPAGTVQGQFHDSFEYQANWAPEVPEKFLALHGYDLRDHGAELAGRGDPEQVARIKADYRSTLAALHLDYVSAWAAWAHARGQTARNQAHGVPGNLLDLYAVADVPETEIFGSQPFPIPGFRRDAAATDRPAHPPIIHRFASSAAHVAGRPLVSSETFTWLREHFHESPAAMKPELDALFLAGINHVFFHGAAYSPADVPWPGWVFYASSQLNPRNPLWRDLGDGVNAYIARAQSLLQAGQPDNDLLVYWPVDDLWHNPAGLSIPLSVHADWLQSSATGRLMNNLTNAGCTYDLISDAQLQLTRFADRRLRTPGASYTAIVVPPTRHMPLPTLQRLLALAADGAAVLFVDSLPDDVPGFGSLEARRADLRAALGRLQWKSVDQGSVKSYAAVGAGGVVLIENAGTYFRQGTTRQRETLVDHGLQFIRRRLDDGYVYFIANLSSQPFEGWIALLREAQGAVQLDARRGGTTSPLFRQRDGSAEIFLQQAPGESCFIRTFTAKTTTGPATLPLKPAGPAIAVEGTWTVTALRGGPELPSSFQPAALGSWTGAGGEWERFAGTACYELEFTGPTGIQADDWQLDVGDVRETARIFVNGQEADLLWSLPMRTTIGHLLRPGQNSLVIEVTNLPANRIRDLDRRQAPWKNFHDINFVDIHYRPFDAANWPLTASGLVGPITLTPLRRFNP